MQINWSRDELVLACDLVRQNDWWELRPSDPRVVQLSRRLQVPFAHPMAGRPDNFRNANGVSRKTADIMTQLPHYRGKSTKGGRLDLVVLEEFLGDPVAMAATADHLVSRIDAGEWGPLPDVLTPLERRTPARLVEPPPWTAPDTPPPVHAPAPRALPPARPRIVDGSIPESALARALLESPTFREQHARSGRHALPMDLVHAVITFLAVRQGRASTRELAAAAGLGGRSFEPTLAAMRRLLNVEGYTVLTLDADMATVRLDMSLLRDQFMIGAA